MLLVGVSRGLVVDDRQPLGPPFERSTITSARPDHCRVAEVELERPLDLPDTLKLVLPLVDVAIDQLGGPDSSSADAQACLRPGG